MPADDRNGDSTHGYLAPAASSPTAAALRTAIGASPSEPVEVVTPQFRRERDYPEPAAPPTPETFEALSSMDASALRELGLRPWGAEEDEHGDELQGGRCLWLFPGEWYSAIPAGFMVTDIFFVEEAFSPGVTDDDIRFGCLPFGVIGPQR